MSFVGQPFRVALSKAKALRYMQNDLMCSY
jgi:hypothetical protein